MTTHVICEKCDENEYKEFKKYQNVHVISKHWIIESLKFKRKVLEEDYQIKPLKNENGAISFITYNSNNNNFESFKITKSSKLKIEGKDFTFTQKNPSNNNGKIRPFNSNDRNSSQNENLDYSLPTLKKSKSMNPRMISSFASTIEKKSNDNEIKLKGFLFKNVYFFFPEDVKGMSVYKRMVLENSGKIVTDIAKAPVPSDKKIFAIFKDGGFDQITHRKYKKYKDKVMVLSFRYILFCIEKKTVINDPVSEKLIHLLPFPKKKYSEDFKKINIFIKGFDLEKNSSLKKTAEILGFKVMEEEEEADVLVLDDKLYQKVNKKDGKCVFMKEKWLLKCLTSGELSERTKAKFNNLGKDFGFEDQGTGNG